MKVTEHIAKANKTLFSFEILPPLKGETIESIYDTLDPLMEVNPPFIDVTYHREEVVYKRLKNGLVQPKTIRKRPGTVGIAAALKHKYNVDAVPHLICGGFSKEETENALIDLDFLGIENVLVLRGDPAKGEKKFIPTEGGHAYAIELLEQVQNMNSGRYLDEELENSHATDFCVGVAGYPEKHFESPNMKTDLQFLKQKVDAGADYIVTQLFFNNEAFFSFEKACRQIGIQVPIIPGLKPLSTSKHLSLLPNFFHLDLPEDLTDAVMKAKSVEQIREIGIDWTVQQSKELINHGVPCLHFYTMGRSRNIEKIVNQLA